MKSQDISSFLAETEFCDFNHPEIREKAVAFKNEFQDPRVLAQKLFYFTRDITAYSVGNWNRKASETLREQRGTCTNNANLLVALLRACGIPAGYGVMEVSGPDYFGPIVLPHLSVSVSKRSKHIYAYVYLAEQWIKCDPSDDEPLSVNTQHLNPQSKLVEWNGINDAILNLHPSHILSEEGPIANIDHLMRKRQRRALWIPVRLGNLYIDFLRAEGRKFSSVPALHAGFTHWLQRRSLIDYAAYGCIVSIQYLRRAFS